MIEIMLNAGAAQQLLPAKGNEREAYRKIPLLMAARHGNLALMRLLLEKGGDEQVNLVDHEGVGSRAIMAVLDTHWSTA